MNVHLTGTPEFPISILNEVGLLLNQTPGELDFITGKPLPLLQCSLKNPRFQNPETIESLNFDELFGLCDAFRAKNDITENEWVILLTTIRNTKKWFSAFNGRNIFVDGLDWEYYTKRDGKFGIAYQIVENIFQSMIELNIDNVYDEPNIHIEFIGCINDMCANKKEIMFKLRTADICESCLQRAVDKAVNPLVLDHISRIIRKLRENFVNSYLIDTIVKPEMVHVDPIREVTIGRKKLKLDAIKKVLFIFFLKNLEGVETQLIFRCEEDLYNLYKEVRQSATRETIQKMVVGPDNNFESYRTKLNKALVNQLGPKLAEFYILDTVVISDSYNKYKINLQEKLIRIDPYKEHK
jgi:hypothetical protein